MGAQWSQFFPPQAKFTETNISSQDGKVFLITGGTSGIGYEVAKILYSKNARVYIAGRSADKATKALSEIRAAAPASTGTVNFLHLALDDLTTIKSTVDAFMSKETRLHILWNNAGVSQPPARSTSKQGFELQLATNCLGPFLLTKLLQPLLDETAAEEARNSVSNSVRVVWTASQMIELAAPPEGIVMSELTETPKGRARNYTNSKTGNFLLAAELARRTSHSESGLISVSTNPGAASTDLFRHTPWMAYLSWPLLHRPRLAAYTQLYAGLSEDIKRKENGCYVVPWGRIHRRLREDLVEATMTKEEGGTEKAKEFWKFCEEKTQGFV